MMENKNNNSYLKGALLVDSLITVCYGIVMLVALAFAGLMLLAANSNHDSAGEALGAGLGAVLAVLLIFVGIAAVVMFVYSIVSTALIGSLRKKSNEMILQKRKKVVASAVMSFVSTALFVMLAIACAIKGGEYYYVILACLFMVGVDIMSGILKLNAVKFAQQLADEDTQLPPQ